MIIEDDPVLSQDMQTAVTAFATADVSLSGRAGLTMAGTGVYDVIVLDIMLPELNGFEVLKALRADGIDTPVLILTARGTIADKMRGFNSGADDYLTKPFHREELQMRLKALLRRGGRLAEDAVLTAGPLQVWPERRQAEAAGQPVTLTGKAFDLLVYLMQNQNIIITKAQIFDRLWGLDSDTALTVVEVYMSNMRKQLKPSGADRLIKTIRNVGYILQPEGQDETK
nr:response regulator transcription factor [Lacticaseibacillus absianus]